MVDITKDFYHYVNNDWIKSTSIPDNEAFIGTFTDIKNLTNKKLISLVEKIINGKIIDDEYKALGILYTQFFERKNLTEEVLKFIKLIKSIKTIDHFRRLILIELFITHDIPNPLNFDCKPNITNSNYNVLGVENNGLGMIDKELYFDDNKKDIRDKYKLFLQKYLTHFKASIDWTQVYKMEEMIAKFSLSNVEQRIRPNTNIKLTDTSSEYIDFLTDLKLFLTHNKIKCPDLNISIYNVKFLKEFYKMLTQKNLELLKNYYCYLLLLHLGKYISSETETLLFDFFKTVLRGIKIVKDIKERSLDILELNLETLLGKLYMEFYFNKMQEEQVCVIINAIFDEFKKQFNTSWMQPETKAKALEKIDEMKVKIGGPTRWPKFSLLRVTRENNLIQNVLACGKFELLTNMIDMCILLDKSKWYMGAYQINAYYIREMNEIVFPAGILQSPFLTDDMASNFGAIGIIIAHEISHGFDDIGSLYDSKGNYKNWWTTEDKAQFSEIATSIENLFSQLKIEGQNINGKLTLGENISDLCGTSIALGAMKSFYGDKITTDNFKRFFYSVANVYKFKFRREETLRRLVSDTHAPPVFRTNIVLSQLEDFYKTFNIKSGDQMYVEPSKRVKTLF